MFPRRWGRRSSEELTWGKPRILVNHSAHSTPGLDLGGERRQSVVVDVVAGVLFAVHPVHVEAVANVVCRAELLSGCCFLASVLAYMRYSRPSDRPRALRRTDRGRPIPASPGPAPGTAPGPTATPLPDAIGPCARNILSSLTRLGLALGISSPP
eukprot:1190984-Prorocentrum_minimum.AAC.3